jgi:transcriptional regulator with XRE-family HTH domain
MKKIPKEAIRGAIQMEWMLRKQTKMTIKKIAEKFSVSVSTVNKWKEGETPREQIRKRKLKLNRWVRNYIYKLAVDKFTGNDLASSRRIANLIFKKFIIKFHPKL